MFCEHCGTKIEEEGQFCQSCGKKSITSAGNKTNDVKSTTVASPILDAGDIFYSEEWRRKKVFAVASLPYFDVMTDKKFLYIIQMPRYSGGTWGLILGLVILNILGAAIGAALGSSNDAKKRKWYRSAWMSPEHKLTSREYVNDIFIQVPLENLKGNIVMGKNKFTLSYGGKMIVLQKVQKEFDRFMDNIKKYVL